MYADHVTVSQYVSYKFRFLCEVCTPSRCVCMHACTYTYIHVLTGSPSALRQESTCFGSALSGWLVNVCMHVCMHVCVCVCMCVCVCRNPLALGMLFQDGLKMYVCVYVCMYVCVSVCMCVCVCRNPLALGVLFQDGW